MTPFPNDILNEIFLHLHQIDQVECMLVCHHWKRIIENYTLYHTIVLQKSIILNTIAAKIKENPEINKRIQQFIIFDDFIDKNKIDIKQFLSSLPNLRILRSYKEYPGLLHDSALLKKETQCPWHKSIEYIDFSMNSVLFHLLTAYICPNLTTIIANLDKEKNIIHLLKNAPALKDLTLRNGKINFADLNTLHENTPRLDSLSLIQVLLDNTGYDDKAYYTTTVITKCSYFNLNMKEFQKVSHWLVYISKKHPNLSELYLYCDTHNLIDDIHSDGWAPFFQNTSLGLKKLRIGSMKNYCSRFFSLLDISDCQINHLDIPINQSDTIQRVVRTQQIHYIETLVLNFVNNQTFEWLKQLCVLKNLEISGTWMSIQLETILIHSPSTLRSLVLKHTSVTVSLDYAKKSLLETLNFQGVHFPEGTDIFINQVFPNLSKLYLIFWMKRGVVWELPNTNLSVFQFRLGGGDKDPNILIKTYNNNESRSYTVKDSIYARKRSKNSLFYERPYKVRPENENMNTPVFTLCCHSLKNIQFVSHVT